MVRTKILERLPLKTMIIFAAGVLILTACAFSPELEPAEDETFDTPSTEDHQTAPDSEPTDVEPGEEDGPADDDVTKVAPSGTVNLGDLTPAPTGESSGDLIVMPAPGIPDPRAKVVQLASADLAQSAGKDISEVQMVSVREVTWPDSSLGCPQEGMLYTQVLTPGFIIMLELDGVAARYHSDFSSTVVRCDGSTNEGLPPVDQ